MGPEYVTHEELTAAVSSRPSREELQAMLNSLQPQLQLAVVNGLKEALPAVLSTIDDRYMRRVEEMHETLYDKEDGLVIVVDRLSIQAKEIPGLVKMRWQLFGLVLASNIIAVVIGWWACTNFTRPVELGKFDLPAPIHSTR